MRHAHVAAAAFLLFAGCAGMRSGESHPADRETVGDTTGVAPSPGTMPDAPAPSSLEHTPDAISTDRFVPPFKNQVRRERPDDAEGMDPVEATPERPQEVRPWGDESGKSHVIPAAEIVGFQFLLNAYDRRYDAEDAYRTDGASIRRNLHRGWIIDDDPFATNQIMHPYQGSLVHGFARSAGLTYWESLGYDAAGSALWEVAGETGPPSANDLITTTFGGSFLGEALFRMASLLLEGGGRSPGLMREVGASMISPPTGINRAAFGDRFDGVFPSHEASTFMRFGLGARRNARLADLGALSDAPRDEAVADFSFEYGLPGKPGYTYTRPFDYFQFEAAATSSSHALPESIMTRGLLFGAPYAVGDSYRGIWGLYGSYDYMSPEVFSVSSTALSLGSTGQFRVSDAVTLQGTLLGGVGWTAVGTIADARTDRDFHYGYSPQGLAAFRFIFGDVVMLDMTGREYYVGGFFSRDETRRENILRGQVSLTVRVYGHHAIGIQFVSSVRNSNVFDVVGGIEEVGALSLFYTYISQPDFGAVDWRDVGHP